MRALLAPISILFFVLLAPPALAADYVGAPETHGPDSRLIDRGPVMPAPAGGPRGAVAKLGAATPPTQVRKLLPSQWCGIERGSDDLSHELGNGTYKYHAVYMIPADGGDHFQAFANEIQANAFAASALLEKLYGRAIRFDLGTSCGSQFLDISVVRMQQTTAQLSQLAGTETGTFNAISDALDQAGFPTIHANQTFAQAGALTKNYVVWLDGPTPGGTCGQGAIYDDPSRDPSNLNNLGGKLAAVYPNGDGNFCDSNTVRHEIGHTLGALQPEAPHAFDGMHCNDAAEDTMCYPDVSPQVANGTSGLYFDYHNDDYWDPPAGQPLGWWTVNLNRFLCPDAACNVVAGGGAGNPPAPVRPASGARAHVRILRHRGRSWKVRVRATGHGRFVVALRCRRHAGGQVDTVLTRRARLPRSFSARLRCLTKPRAQAFAMS